ncbi:unnamed protein product [Trichobilharzia szidati]|nr:unnamed protein product [Trichobilharzia szidati]
MKRPSHPVALHLALPLYFAVSELEICLELSTRMLQIDPSSEYAVYFINRILTIQPSLHEMVTDLFLQRPDILNQLPASKEAEQVDQEIQKIRTIYRKQKDAEMESQIIPVIKFPSPLKHLSWLHLIKETVTMYDHLQAESTIHLVLDLSSLWSEDLLLREIKESSTSNVNVHSNLKPIEQSESNNNNNNATSTGQIEDPHITKAPSSTDTTSELVKDDVNEFNMESGTDDLATGFEKRRSARVRTCFDLSDGLNRYCSRRSVTTELDKVVYDKCKASSSEKLTSSQKEGNNPNDRFKLADRFQTLLPQIFRDLAAYNRKQKISQEVQLSTENSMNDNSNLTTNEVVSVNSEQVTLNQSNLWSPKSVHNFLIMLNGMKPNIVTLGISLLLQTCQLSGCRWSSELATAYRNLFQRLQPSFPYFLTIPPSNTLLMDAISQMTEDANTCLLPECVLALRKPPGIKHLAYFYLIYIELHLEELEANPSSSSSTTGPKGRNSLTTEISTSLFSVLNEILSKVEETSPDYPIIMSHLLWIDYLMCSRRRDYTEMKECVLALQKHLLAHKIVVSRAYSVRHGDLTLDYMNHLLSKLKDVSSFDRLIQLSHDGQHADVLLELTRIFQLQRGTNSKSSSYSCSSTSSSSSSSSSASSSLSSSDQSHSLKQLNLFYNSLKHLITDMITKTGDYAAPREGNNTAAAAEDVDMDVTPLAQSSSTSTSSSLSTYYNYCILLIEECLIRLTESNQEQMMTMSEASVNSIASIAMKTIKFLIKCWNLLGDNCVNEDDFNSRQFPIKSNSSSDISSIANLPLKLLTYLDDSVYSIRTSSKVLSNWTMNFYLKLVSLLYEHLRCIEESIPCSALPIELRIYQSGVELSEEIPLELKLNAYCGSVSAPPSIVCLHLFHEFSILLFTSSATSSNNNNTIITLCRDSTGIVKLLIQLAIRSCNELQSISARFYSPDLRWNLETGGSRIETGATTSTASTASTTTPTTTDDGIVSNAGNIATTNINNNNNECSANKGQTPTDEYMAPISPDDNTVACTDDLHSSSLCNKSWPTDSVCLAQVLSCTIKCLLGNCLTREITTFYQPTEKYLSLDFVESYEFMQIYNCIKTKYGDGFINFIPEWINTVKNLFDSWDVFDHHHAHQQQYQLLQQQQLQQSMNTLNNKSNWWNSPSLSSADCDTHQEGECLDWECVKIIFLFACPSPFPEYDSVKTLSISNEMLKFLCDAAKIMPTCELDKMLPKSSIDSVIQSKAKEIHLPSVPKGLSFLTKSMYYLIADHYMKNNQFHRAVEYYLKDLCVSPQRIDTWAALGLIYSSDLEQVLNLTNLKTERISAEAVYRCLRCFNIALHLQPDTVTLLIERGCLAYQLHSYGARIVKKSEYRNFPDVHLNLCRKWRHRMLQLARSSYESALNLCSSAKHHQRLERGVDTVKVGTSTSTSTTSSSAAEQQQDNIKSNRLGENDLIDNNNKNENKSDNKAAQSKEEEWLCHYMLAKCAEKDAYLIKQSEDVHPSSRLMHVLRLYHDALKALDSAGAKYPKKIIFYNKIPFRAVEAIEVYYRIHALSLKTLLKCGSPVTSTQPNHSAYPINLVELDQFLGMIDTSEFVTSAKKPCRRNRKRTANMAGLSSKTNQSQKIANQNGPGEGQNNKPMQQNESATVSRVNDQPVDVTAYNKSGQSSNIPLIPGTIPSQEEFIDLTLPDPPLQEDEELVNVPEASSSVESTIDKLTLWKKCVDRCRCALELVLQRLPLHYKAMYRLASMYLYAPHLKDPNKALDILLGPAEVSSKPSSTANNNNNTTNASSSTQTNIGGLFKDRKQNNFFYGVWRIPTADIDRSGNFAAHMYRSVSLTLSLLHDQGDWRRLVHIFHQLRKQPPEEKRGFLGEGDRVYLARRAFSLIQPTLFNWLTQLSLSLAHRISEQISKDNSLVFNSDISSITANGFLTMETLTQIYRLHCVSYSRNSSTSSSGQLNSSSNSFNSSLCSPTSPSTTTTTTATTPSSTNASTSSSNVPEVATVAAAETSGYASVLQLAYRLCPTVWDSRGPLVPLDWILRRCNELSVTKSQLGISESPNAINKA